MRTMPIMAVVATTACIAASAVAGEPVPVDVKREDKEVVRELHSLEQRRLRIVADSDDIIGPELYAGVFVQWLRLRAAGEGAPPDDEVRYRGGYRRGELRLGTAFGRRRFRTYAFGAQMQGNQRNWLLGLGGDVSFGDPATAISYPYVGVRAASLSRYWGIEERFEGTLRHFELAMPVGIRKEFTTTTVLNVSIEAAWIKNRLPPDGDPERRARLDLTLNFGLEVTE